MKRTKHTVPTFLLALFVTLGLSAAVTGAASAVDSVSYLDANGETRTAASATEVTGDDTGWSGTDPETGDMQARWYVVNGDVTISGRITVTGDVHLILADGAKLTA